MLAPFANEPVLELRRASVRSGPAVGAGTGRGDAAAVGPGADRRRPPRGRGARLHGSRPPRPARRPGRRRPARRGAGGDRGRPRGAETWGQATPEHRAAALVKAAAWMRERRLELAALEVRECAKPWLEADGDVCEAIDFLEYYARAAIALGHGRELLQVPGERNELRYGPRGIIAVISPWNFPLAIACGMTVGRAGHRQRGRAQTRRAVAGDGRPARGGAARRRRTRRRRCRCCPARVTWAPRSSVTRRWPRSPSPARCRSGRRSCAPPPRSPTASASSSP